MDSLFDRLPDQRTSRWWRITTLLAVIIRRQTYLNLAYLIAAFPLGFFYFLVLIVGFSVGVGTAIIGVGICAADSLRRSSRGALRHSSANWFMWWLNVRIRPMSTPPPSNTSAWHDWSVAFSAIRSCGKAYLSAGEFPFSGLSFVSVLTVLSLAASLILSPVAYLARLQRSTMVRATSYMSSGGVQASASPASIARFSR